MDMSADTIVAIATPPGRGGIGVVRVSGTQTPQIAEAILGSLPSPRQASLKNFLGEQGQAIDMGLALYFPAPHSFTGEPVLELHGHGGPVVLDQLVNRVLGLGARLARPGEFSERAFLNDKIDLVQAEAIADLISSDTAAAAHSALRSLQGHFSHRIQDIVDGLINVRTYVEAAIDFPEEEIDFLAGDQVLAWLSDLSQDIETLLADTRQGCLLREGMSVVLAGPPNVGKSSLLNALARQDAAIVSEIPGTTRDPVRREIQINGLPVHVTDTAGLRETGDAIETEGVRRARDAAADADRVLLLIDDSVPAETDLDELQAQLGVATAVTIVRNKIDLSGRAPGLIGAAEAPEIALSAKTGAGLAALREHLQACMGYQPAGEGSFIARRRHLLAVEQARQHLIEGERQLRQAAAGELLAEELRAAQRALGEITGEFTADDLLGEIFSSFCIGK